MAPCWQPAAVNKSESMSGIRHNCLKDAHAPVSTSGPAAHKRRHSLALPSSFSSLGHAVVYTGSVRDDRPRREGGRGGGGGGCSVRPTRASEMRTRPL